MRWDIDSVREFVESNSDCKLLSTEYKNTKVKLNFKCNCTKEFETSFEKFKNRNKRQCNECGDKNKKLPHKKWTYNEIVEYVKDFGVIVVSDSYKTLKNKMTFKCSCGRDFETNFGQFLAGKHTCDKCSKEKIRNYFNFTIEEVREYVRENSDCELVSNTYINNTEPLEFICSCGNHFYQPLTAFKVSDYKVCRICSQKHGNDSKRYSYEYVKNYIESNSNCKLLSTEYTQSKKKLLLKCDCKKEFKTTFDMFVSGKIMCNECSLKLKGIERRLKYEDVKLFVEENSESTLLSLEYNNIKDNLLFECECGRTFETNFDSFKSKNLRRCKKCTKSISKGELKVINFLEDNDITFIYQHTFKDCKHKKILPFDFYLPEYNLLIPINGQQHYYSVRFGGISQEKAEENFIQQQLRDSIKYNYAKDNSIDLLIIPYTEFNNIEEILTKELNLS